MNNTIKNVNDGKLIRLRISNVIIFAICMGILEAICVMYIRQIMFPPDGNITNIPITNFNFSVEAIREAMTIIMLTTTSILAAYNVRTRLAMFFLAFGTWDILYYVGLRIFLQWPASIMDWDTLFLLPVAWYSPVLVPVLISIYFIFGSIFIVLHEGNGTKLKFSFSVVLLQFSAFIFWFYSFIINSAIISENGYANAEYSWVLFFLGLALGVSSLSIAYIQGQKSN
ncbi:hypothetical protein KKF86_00665 [bacterium]|nr:hypothetical protein [bacterium]